MFCDVCDTLLRRTERERCADCRRDGRNDVKVVGGAVVGGLVAGPVGVVVGGLLGALLGDD